MAQALHAAAYMREKQLRTMASRGEREREVCAEVSGIMYIHICEREKVKENTTMPDNVGMLCSRALKGKGEAW